MPFLTKAELKTKTHVAMIDAVTLNDATIVDIIIDENISYMKSFLAARYNVEAIFNAAGSARNNVVLKILKDLVIFDIYHSHNPVQVTEVLKDARTRAENWLKAVQKAEINPDLPLAVKPESVYVQYGSNPKRHNSY